MIEYIEREAAKNAFPRAEADAFENCRYCTCLDSEQIGEILDNVPAADVRPVVRCGECENWQRDWKPNSAKDGTHFCANVGFCTSADFFCADGERKDGDGE